MDILYRFKVTKDLVIEQQIQLPDVTFNNNNNTKANNEPEHTIYPQWSELTYQQCSNCTLSSNQYKYCPLAINIHKAVIDCDQLISYDEIELEVITPQRTYIASCTAQKALSSYFGLMIGLSECPHTAFFKPMAQFHLPLSSKEESMFRVMGTYFLSRYFSNEENDKNAQDITQLLSVYKNLQIVNEFIAKRLSGVVEGDASSNAVVLLHMLSCVMGISIGDSLKELRKYFVT